VDCLTTSLMTVTPDKVRDGLIRLWTERLALSSILPLNELCNNSPSSSNTGDKVDRGWVVNVLRRTLCY